MTYTGYTLESKKKLPFYMRKIVDSENTGNGSMPKFYWRNMSKGRGFYLGSASESLDYGYPLLGINYKAYSPA